MFDPGVLRALAEEAETKTEGVTEGPWEYVWIDGPLAILSAASGIADDAAMVACCNPDCFYTMPERAFEFIAWARTAVPEFARLARGAAERIDTLEAALGNREQIGWVSKRTGGWYPIVRAGTGEFVMPDDVQGPLYAERFVPVYVYRDDPAAAPAVSPVPEPTPKMLVPKPLPRRDGTHDLTVECAECGDLGYVLVAAPDGRSQLDEPCPSCAVPVPKAEGDR